VVAHTTVGTPNAIAAKAATRARSDQSLAGSASTSVALIATVAAASALRAKEFTVTS
jgi:hypothetical protein